jgi:hypothetical protein
MPRIRALARHTWTTPDHDGCIVCTPYVLARHQSTLRAIRLVAASLPSSKPPGVESDPTKQEPAGIAVPTGSTAHTVCDTEVRAARAQCDTQVG